MSGGSLFAAGGARSHSIPGPFSLQRCYSRRKDIARNASGGRPMQSITRRRLIAATAGIAAAALAPHIDARTMEIHPERHHQAYVTNLNNIAKDHPEIAQKPITEVLAKLGELPESIGTLVRINLGGHANHTMFWPIMGLGGGKPSGDVAAAIDRDLGGLEKFQNDFNAAGGRVFGSGWVFVLVGRDGKLALE